MAWSHFWGRPHLNVSVCGPYFYSYSRSFIWHIYLNQGWQTFSLKALEPLSELFNSTITVWTQPGNNGAGCVPVKFYLWEQLRTGFGPQTVVQFSLVAQLCPTLQPHESQHARPPCPSPSPGVHSNSRPSSWWCHPATSSRRPLLLLPPIPSSIRVFSNESNLCMRWPKYWSFSFSINPSNEHPGLISFRMDWLDLLAVQGTLKSI